MIRSDVFVVIQTVAGREAALAETLKSIAASDLEQPDAVVVHEPRDKGALDVFVDERAYTLRFEDDVIVHPKILGGSPRVASPRGRRLRMRLAVSALRGLAQSKKTSGA